MSGGGSSTTPTRLNALQVSTSSQGLVIPKVWGTGRLKVNLLWYNQFQSQAQQTSSGKGGGSQTTGYTYSAALILGVCSGPIASVGTVYVNTSVFTSVSAAGLSLATGALGQSVWGWLTSNYPAQAIGYSGIAYLYAPSYSLGSSATTPNISMEVKSNYTFSSLPDCLPDVILTDFLTDTKDGVPGWPSGVLASLTNWSTYCQAANLLLSPVIDSQVTASAFIDDMMAATNSACFWSEGLLKVMPLGDNSVTGNGTTWTPSLTPAYSLTDDSFVEAKGEPPIYVDISDQTDAYNIIQVEYLDRSNQYNIAIASRQDDSNIAQFGPRKQDPKTLHMICDPIIAANVAQIVLQQTLYVRGQYHFSLPWNYALLEQTDLLSITDTGMGLSNFLVRIMQIDDDEDGERTIMAVEVPVGAASPPIYSHQDGGGYTPNYAAAASAVATPYIFNPPSTLTTSGQEVWIAVCGSTPSTWGGCYVWTSLDGTNYQNVGTILAPSRYGTLSATLPLVADPDTTSTLGVDLTLSKGALLTATAADRDALVTLCLIDNELVAYQTASLTSSYHYNLTSLRRGAMGTTIASHASGAEFVRIDGKQFVVPFNANTAGKTVYIKLQSFNPLGGGVQDISTCTAYTFVPGTTLAGSSSNGNTSGGGQIGSTQNQVFYQSTDPALTQTVNDGALWTNTATSTLNLRIHGAWVIISTLSGVTAGTVMFDSQVAGAWSFTIPFGATTSAQVEIWGGGGGADGAEGGGGGAYSTTTYTVTPGTTAFGGALGAAGSGKDVSIPQVASNGGVTTLATGGSMTAGGGACAVLTTPGAGGTASGGTTNTAGTSGTSGLGGGAGNGGGNVTASGATGSYPGGGGMWANVGLGGNGNGGRVRITAR